MHSILVFRALMLGDWLCATPALRALRHAAPRARLVLCGLPASEELARRLDTVDDFLAFPGHPALPERQPAPGELPRFIDHVRAQRFDVALQMHGSGGIVNGIVASFGARMSAGFGDRRNADGLDSVVPWPDHGHEVERCLALVETLGAPRQGLHLDLPLSSAERRATTALLAALGVNGRYAVVHAGAQLPSRRWPPERFATVADALARRGLAVLLTGGAQEAPITSAVRAACRCAPIDLAGRTPSLGVLAGLIDRAALLVANDTGLSHVAAALRTPSIIVASGSDVARWAPRDRALHRVLWQDVPCRPCAHRVCPTGHECAVAVPASGVVDAVGALLKSLDPCPIRDAFAS